MYLKYEVKLNNLLRKRNKKENKTDKNAYIYEKLKNR